VYSLVAEECMSSSSISVLHPYSIWNNMSCLLEQVIGIDVLSGCKGMSLLQNCDTGASNAVRFLSLSLSLSYPV
jgi:hypothetical protein